MRVVLTLIVVASLLLPLPAGACALFYGVAGGARVDKEEALIIWDPDTGTEHFIRKTDFSVHAKDFGFLVPTPSPPEIAEASDAVFAELSSLFQPEPKPISYVPKDRAFAPGSASVTVLEEKRVGSMDVAVLQATDVEALMNWLNSNGYKQNPQQKDWLNRCVKLGMTVSAFKYAGGETDVKVTADTVRLSFRTDRPFFPYHEPKRDADGRRRLDIFVVAPTAVTALRGQRNEKYEANSDALSVSLEKNSLKSRIPGVVMPQSATVVTRFVDYSTQRAPGDLYFVSAPKVGE